MRIAAITDIGLHRKRNEDHYLIDEDRGVFVVCDGMGGHKGGDVASQLAVEIVQKNLVFTDPEQVIPALLDTVHLANRLIYEQGQSDETLHEMGTTLTAAVIQERKMVVAHIGDSSLFFYHDGRLSKVTQDHTLAEQMLTDGLIKPADLPTNVYNHVLTRAVGINPQVEVDIYQEEIQPGDWILICSDGLTDLVKEKEIVQHLSSAQTPQQAARALIDSALGQGGFDNVTVVLVSI
jgi:protein phosphatase